MADNDDEHLKDGIIDFLAGSFGGVALVYVGQPFDTIKVKMQTYPKLYTNMFHCFKKTLKTDGIARGLYAGTFPALGSNVTENAVLFLSYGFCKKFLLGFSNANSTEELSTFGNASAGFLAAFFAGFAITPPELIKCKLQAMSEFQKQAGNDTGIKMGPTELVFRILRTEGITGLYRGLIPTLAREMPGYFFFFGGYEGTRQLLCKPSQKKEELGLWETMVAGSVGGGLFWTVMYPIDVAKSRIQVKNIELGLVAVLLKIYRNDGFRGFYSGLLPTLLRSLPATAALFVTFEYSKKLMYYLAD